MKNRNKEVTITEEELRLGIVMQSVQVYIDCKLNGGNPVLALRKEIETDTGLSHEKIIQAIEALDTIVQSEIGGKNMKRLKHFPIDILRQLPMNRLK